MSAFRAAVLAAFALCATSGVAVAGPTAGTIAALSITGHGFGAGIGLSQWGAEERAVAGQGYTQILSFYYPGTRLGSAASRNVRVLVADRAQVRIGSRAAFSVRDRLGRVVRVPAGHYDVAMPALVHLAWPLVVEPGADALQVGGVRYLGTITLRRARGGRFLAVDTLELEDYVAGVVSSECPAYWRPAALQAQAVASRTYALANLRPEAPFDLYPDDRSQNYRGLTREFASARAATAATAGQILLYSGHPADAMFSASNGGLTSALSTVPYTRTRPDPFDARSPDADWGPVQVVMPALLRAFPSIPQNLTSVTARRDAADRVVSLSFVGSDGAAVTIGGRVFQERLGLRSTFFSIALAR
jgi:SpoIID/LytB domain protein